MVLFSMVVGQMDLDMDMEFVDLQMGMSTVDIGKKGKRMEKGLRDGQGVMFSMVVGKMDLNMDLEFIHMLMGMSILENGKKMKNSALPPSTFRSHPVAIPKMSLL